MGWAPERILYVASGPSYSRYREGAPDWRFLVVSSELGVSDARAARDSSETGYKPVLDDFPSTEEKSVAKDTKQHKTTPSLRVKWPFLNARYAMVVCFAWRGCWFVPCCLSFVLFNGRFLDLSRGKTLG